MIVFLPLLSTRELSDTSICIPQESHFDIFLVTFPSSGCSQMSLALGKKLLTNNFHCNTHLSPSLLPRQMDVWLVSSTSASFQVSQVFVVLQPQGRTFSHLKLEFLESCCWAMKGRDLYYHHHVYLCSWAISHPILTFLLFACFAFQDDLYSPLLGTWCIQW